MAVSSIPVRIAVEGGHGLHLERIVDAAVDLAAQKVALGCEAHVVDVDVPARSMVVPCLPTVVASLKGFASCDAMSDEANLDLLKCADEISDFMFGTKSERRQIIFSIIATCQ